MDAFFAKGFKGSKCKTLFKLTIPRIKLLRNRREAQLKQMRRDIAKLLQNGQEPTARIRVEHVIREENMMAAQEIVELFCELIVVRLPIIEAQRECPLDLKEAISTICFAAPRCSDLPELQQIQMLFAAKYGREFVAAATELMPDCGVNRQVIELLSIRAPPVEAKMKLLKEIAAEHDVEWDSAESESELLKPHEDLLNGPNHLLGGSTLPLPKEKHMDFVSSCPVDSHYDTRVDEDLDSLHLPDVPQASVQPSSSLAAAPEIAQHLQSSLQSSTMASESSLSDEFLNDPVKNVVIPKALSTSSSAPNVLSGSNDNEQFVPFISPSPLPPMYTSHLKDTASFLSIPVPPSQSQPASTICLDKCGINEDLQDVLSAAQTAAETAERAATAARAAASLAQVRITQLLTRRSNLTSETSGMETPVKALNQQEEDKRPIEQQNLSNQATHIPPTWASGSPPLSQHMHIIDPKSPSVEQEGLMYSTVPQPRRSTSLEDDPYFSYPNLFTPRDSSPKSS